MKTNQLYIQTKRDLAKARNQEKMKKNNILLISALVILFIGCFWSAIIGIIAIIYLVVILVYWDKRPWIKRITTLDVAETEIHYELNVSLIAKEASINLLNQKTSDMWDNLDPHKTIEARMEILPLDKEILSLYKEIFEINDTLEIENNPTHLKDVEKLKEEIVLIGEFLEQAKRKS